MQLPSENTAPLHVLFTETWTKLQNRGCNVSNSDWRLVFVINTQCVRVTMNLPQASGNYQCQVTSSIYRLCRQLTTDNKHTRAHNSKTTFCQYNLCAGYSSTGNQKASQHITDPFVSVGEVGLDYLIKWNNLGLFKSLWMEQILALDC